jgi:hypothetical protein
MKDDPAFGDAMQCLHVHECTFEDVDLFNEHVIHSQDFPQGVDLALPENCVAAAIVTMNAVQEQLNTLKADISSALQSEMLVICAANDRLRNTTVLTKELWNHLLGLEVASVTCQALCQGLSHCMLGCQ